jgi:hypothetical protein
MTDLFASFMKNYDSEASKAGLTGSELAQSRKDIGLKENNKNPNDYLKKGVSMEEITELAKNKKLSTNKIKKEIQQLLNDGEDVNEFLQSVKKKFNKSKKETKEGMGTGAGGGSFEPAISFGETKKVETKEGTSTTSSGSYETNKMWAKSMSKKHWRNAGANYMPGAKRVQVKKKCTRFPYCNQGDINALNIFENEIGQKVIRNISEELGVSEQYIKNLIKREIN